MKIWGFSTYGGSVYLVQGESEEQARRTLLEDKDLLEESELLDEGEVKFENGVALVRGER